MTFHIPIRLVLREGAARHLGAAAAANPVLDLVLDFDETHTTGDLVGALFGDSGAAADGLRLVVPRLGGTLPSDVTLAGLLLQRGDVVEVTSAADAPALAAGLHDDESVVVLVGEEQAAGRVVWLGSSRCRLCIGGPPTPGAVLLPGSGDAAVVEVRLIADHLEAGVVSGAALVAGQLIVTGKRAVLPVGATIEAAGVVLRVRTPGEIGIPNAFGHVGFVPSARDSVPWPEDVAHSLPRIPEREPDDAGWPWEQILGPALMGIVFFFVTKNSWFFALLGVSAVMAGVAFWRRGRTAKRRHERRLAEHQVELVKQIERVGRAARDEQDLRLRFIGWDATLACVEGRSVELWGRRPTDSDFLAVRIGVTDVAARVRVDGREAAGLTADQARRLDASLSLHGIPALVELAGTDTGIFGALQEAELLGASCLTQIAAHHSPRDVRIAALLPSSGERSRAMLGFLRWLPHARIGSESRLVATTRAEADDVLGIVESLVADSTAGDGRRAHVVVAVHESAPVDQARLARLLDEAGDHVHLFWIGGTRTSVPGAVDVALHVNGGAVKVAAGALEWTNAIWGFSTDGSENRRALAELARAEEASGGLFSEVARRLSPLIDSTGLTGSDGIAGSVDLTEVVDDWVGDGAERSAVESLEVLLGVGPNGPFSFDLATDGPHMLVGGTTGSGKSELLQTIASGLVRGYPATEVSLLLVDFKGGSTFRPFAALPHVAAYVSNLEHANLDRVLAYLRSELLRRQEVFADAAERHGELEGYAAFREAEPDVVLPRLFLMLDEFATLKESQPAALDAVLNVAQQGRAYGVHLLLATQRPGGVVSAAVRANVGVRVALRTLSGDDSAGIIDVSDAARIPGDLPGRGIVAFGGGRIEGFQAGHASRRQAGTVSSLRLRPYTVGASVVPASRRARMATGPTSLSRTVAQVDKASPRGISPLGENPIDAQAPALRGLAPVEAPTAVALGWIDDPGATDLERKVAPYVVDFSRGAWLVSGTSQQGKTSALLSVAEQLQAASPHVIVGLDSGTGELEALAERGLVTWAIEAGDQAATDLLLAQLSWVLGERYRGVAQDLVPIVLLIDDLDAFSDAEGRGAGTDGERRIEALAAIARRGRRHNVFVAAASFRPVNLDRRLRGAFTQRLQLGVFEVDEADEAVARLALDLPVGVGVLRDRRFVRLAAPIEDHERTAPPQSGLVGPLPDCLPVSAPLADRVVLGLAEVTRKLMSTDPDPHEHLVVCWSPDREVPGLWKRVVAEYAAAGGGPVIVFGPRTASTQDLPDDVRWLDDPADQRLALEAIEANADPGADAHPCTIVFDTTNDLGDSDARVIRDTVLQQVFERRLARAVIGGRYAALTTAPWSRPMLSRAQAVVLDVQSDAQFQFALKMGVTGAAALPMDAPLGRAILYAHGRAQVIQVPTGASWSGG